LAPVIRERKGEHTGIAGAVYHLICNVRVDGDVYDTDEPLTPIKRSIPSKWLSTLKFVMTWVTASLKV
jgi:hypothetical protein